MYSHYKLVALIFKNNTLAILQHIIIKNIHLHLSDIFYVFPNLQQH
ncbi:hypothetical protein ECH_0932 [Ehrlichia chaffeensis str. Arkansas]|uniref:Uncharacterized protein n=1 Tax=Ehrlichia chaffeensis (strain ATCC CRL-10679 / Arkansas) TaxID=205920 RepID=Q2GFR1_EHRCR|nr:hypothetical protein ECH_0932 [Ehrlichia chaffeensis str. Arkansas]